MGLIPITYVGSGLLLMAVSVPLVRRKVRRNPIYGFRVPLTLSSDDIWYPANEYAGRQLFAAGMCISIGCGIVALVPGLTDMGRAMDCLAILSISLIWSVGRSFAYLRRFK